MTIKMVLDTHIWLWYVDKNLRKNLTDRQLCYIGESLDSGLGVSIVSSWEVAKKFQIGKLDLTSSTNPDNSLASWLERASNYTGIVLLPLTQKIILDSVNLPGSFHRDPFDELIVATARISRCPLITNDKKIRDYPFVEII